MPGFYTKGETFSKCAIISRARDDVSSSGAQWFTLSSLLTRAGTLFQSTHRNSPVRTSDSLIFPRAYAKNIVQYPRPQSALDGTVRVHYPHQASPKTYLAHVAINTWSLVIRNAWRGHLPQAPR